MKFATNWSKWILTLGLLLLVPGLVQAQDEEPLPEFGDNRILFVDGPNLTTSQIDGTFVEDVVESGNTVHRISGGAWFSNGYKFDGNGGSGFDFSQNMADVDTVYFRLRINPEDNDNDDGSVRKTSYMVLADKSDGTETDLSWGIRWKFPDDAYDNEWHDYAIPLPKPHIAAHDSALKGLDVDGNPLTADQMYTNELQEQWEFYYAWNPVTSTSISPNDSTLGADPEWDKFGRMYISLGNDRSGTFYLDDVYIGSQAAVDLSVTASLPDAPEAITATTVGDSVSVTWTHNAASNIYSYDVYYSGTPITNVEDPGVNFLGSATIENEFQLGHKVKSPHPNAATQDYYYALSPKTQFGIGNATTLTTASTAASGEVQPYIFELTAEQEEAVLGDLDNGEITGAGWPTTEFAPFHLIGDDGWDDGGTYTGEMDGSAKIWMAFGRLDELQTMYIYVEAYDDDVYGGGPSSPLGSYGTTLYPDPSNGNTWISGVEDFENEVEWNYYLKDQIKFSFGTYDVNYVSGTTHESRMRGDEPDYFMALQPKIDGTNDPIVPMPDGMLTRFTVTEPNTDDPDTDYNMLYYSSNHLFTYSSLYENMFADDDTTRIGWKALMAFDVNDLLVALDESNNPMDSVFEFPAEDQIKYIPLIIEFIDKDGGDPGNWWEVSSHTFRTPTGLGGVDMFESNDQLIGQGVVAMAGKNVTVSNELTDDTPGSFELKQNYPNPFNPSTRISFSLPRASEVNLSVYNVLGQKVATLISNEMYQSGSHSLKFDASALSSGVYFYRIEAGSFVSARKMMLIK